MVAPRLLLAAVLSLGLAGFGMVTAAADPAASPRRPARLSEAARWLQAYLRIDTTNPPGRERPAAAFLAAILHREGIATQLFVTPDGRANLYARLPATAPGDAESGPGALVLTHHMDVVPEGAGWKVDAFAGQVDQERLWGRGALDAKALGIAQLAAMVALERSGRPRHRDLVVLAVADEETGGGRGMGWLAERRPELFEDLWAVFNEGGAGRIVGERLLWWEVEVTQKRPLWMEIVARGRGGHASSFNPESAMHQLVRGLERALAIERPPRVTPAVRRQAAALAPLHNPRMAEILEDLDAHFSRSDPPQLLLPGMHKLFTDTLQVTAIEGSAAINVVPATARARADARLLPDTDGDAFLNAVREALGPGLEVEVLLSAPPAPASPTDSPAYRTIERVLGASAPVVPSMMAGFTDSRHFRQRGIPAYGLSPFAVEATDMLGIHGVDERIPLAAFDAGVERYRRLVELCTGAGR